MMFFSRHLNIQQKGENVLTRKKWPLEIITAERKKEDWARAVDPNDVSVSGYIGGLTVNK